MRFLLHVAAVVLMVIAAVLSFHTIDHSTLTDVLGFVFAGFACFWASSLPVPPAGP